MQDLFQISEIFKIMHFSHSYKRKRSRYATPQTVDEKRSHQGKSLSVSVFLYGKEDVLAK